MKKSLDMDLIRLFEEIRDPVQDEMFVRRVSRRIGRSRSTRRIVLILLSFAMAVVLVALRPWLIDLVHHIALGSSLFAYSLTAMLLSPIGLAWAVGGGLGVLFIIKARL